MYRGIEDLRPGESRPRTVKGAGLAACGAGGADGLSCLASFLQDSLSEGRKIFRLFKEFREVYKAPLEGVYYISLSLYMI